MFTQAISIALLASAALIEAGPVVDYHQLRALQNRQAASATTLAANAIQSGSFVDGSVNGVSAAGQSKSQTSKNNFINNCAGKTLTNGLQVTAGSCNGITMGDIPAKNLMVSSIITFPQDASSTIKAGTTFTITVQTSNLVAGSFTNATSTYYSAPQALSGGKVVGHTHVTVQDLGNSLNPTKPLDPTQFAFFKGINDAGNGNGLLSATVTGGLPAGNYRICTMTSSSNHQPVLMPVAQRGTPDDCSKFTVVGAGGATTGNGAASGASSAAASSATKATGGKASSAASAATSATKATGGKASSAASVATSATKAAGGKAASSSTAAAEVSSKAAGGKAASSSVATSAATKATSSAAAGNGKGGNAASSSAAPVKASATSAKAAATSAASASTGSTAGALGGITAPAVQNSGDSARPFLVNGNTFVNEAAAKQRSCDIQFNACANAVNGQKLTGVTIGDCSTQQTTCNSA
ncbi:hypothetical protein BGZ60DRAFT_426680 [Tricladium varicosporioides]|nr:hypothetical protein BGZ60DRAFT_426680 [Hymenoscyphus varicosporioides]